MFFAVYDKKTGDIECTVSAPFYIPEMFALSADTDVIEIPREANDITEYIKDGVLELKPDIFSSSMPIEEVQYSVWANIKERRSLELSRGVTVQSVDKVFQTDNDSITQYTNIAGMIALNNYIPVQWKTMDNSWITLTVELFKELQAAISIKTNTNFQVAELHKANMMLSSKPQDYDYSTGWV